MNLGILKTRRRVLQLCVCVFNVARVHSAQTVSSALMRTPASIVCVRASCESFRAQSGFCFIVRRSHETCPHAASQGRFDAKQRAAPSTSSSVATISIHISRIRPTCVVAVLPAMAYHSAGAARSTTASVQVDCVRFRVHVRVRIRAQSDGSRNRDSKMADRRKWL